MTVKKCRGMNSFGQQLKTEQYIDRPGAYAILLNDAEEICLINEKGRYTLPGGGSDPGESLEETVSREVKEETGYDIKIINTLDYAIQYCLAKGEGYFKKECTYFECKVSGNLQSEYESGQYPEWFEPRVALEKLLIEDDAHSWVLQKYIAEKKDGLKSVLLKTND
jgi:8-oxo-dGTP diphosphatase